MSIIYQKLSQQTILKFALKWDWKQFCQHQLVFEEVISQCIHLACLYYLLKYQTLSEGLIKQISMVTVGIDVLECFRLIKKCQLLSHSFIVENYKYLPLTFLIKSWNLQEVPTEFLIQKVLLNPLISQSWKYELWHIVLNQAVSDAFCNDYHSHNDFNRLVKAKQLSDKFLLTLKYKFDWKIVLQYQKISSDFSYKLPKPYAPVEGPIDDDLTCSICLDTLNDVVQLNPYMHLFSMSCISTYSSIKPSCRLCRQNIIIV